MKRLLRFTAGLAASMSALSGLLLLVPIRSRGITGPWWAKLLPGALAPRLAALGGASAGLGVGLRSPLTVALGGAGALINAAYVWQIARPRRDLEQALGPAGHGRRVPTTGQWPARLTKRWQWRAPLPPVPVASAVAGPARGRTAPRWARDVEFAKVESAPGAIQPLLCDLWQPPIGVAPSGLGLIYLHGSAWHLADKDLGTRPMFAHLATQGHVVMDVAYRLCPDVDLMGMLGDVRRAVIWLREHAAEYGVDPTRLVLSGGSAGGHLALLAAYTPGHPDLTPPGLAGADTAVCGVVSWYAPVDLVACFSQALPARPERAHQAAVRYSRLRNAFLQSRYARRFERDATIMATITPEQFGANLVGVTLDQEPAAYETASPCAHVRPGLPPTLLIQGAHDPLVPVQPARDFAQALRAAHVPVAYLELPFTTHAFDLVLPAINPAAQAALFEVDAFLARLAQP